MKFEKLGKDVYGQWIDSSKHKGLYYISKKKSCQHLLKWNANPISIPIPGNKKKKWNYEGLLAYDQNNKEYFFNDQFFSDSDMIIAMSFSGRKFQNRHLQASSNCFSPLAICMWGL